MAEFIALNPDAQVIGRAIMGVAMALGDSAHPILQKYGLDQLDPNGWYPQQAWLDVLREVDQGDMFDLVAIGKEVAGLVPLPGEVDSVESVIMMMGETYRFNNRNCPGTSKCVKVGSTRIDLTISDPYPRNMVYGVIWGFARRFAPKVIVRYPNDQPCPTEAESCTFIVSW